MAAIDDAGLSPLLVTLALALAFFLLGRPLRMRPLRRLADLRAAPPSRASWIGTDGGGEPGAFGVTFRASLGLRLISTLLVMQLLVQGWRERGVIVEWAGGGAGGLLAAFGIGLAALWYLAFVWRYEVTLERDRITFTSLSLGVSRRDLAGLVAVEDDRAYMLRLFFRDQPQAEVFRMVSGAAAMRARIESHLPRDEAPACQSFRKSRRSAGA